MTKAKTRKVCSGSGSRWTLHPSGAIVCFCCGTNPKALGLGYQPRPESPHHTIPVHDKTRVRGG